ncbi:MAG: hypothetical protein IJC79_00050 [Clostridia bacterium]|nr:hypothetical protein [Clostridia bacterium]
MTKLLSFLISVILLFESVPVLGPAALKVDAGEAVGVSSTRATGFLYGLAESGVPSEAMTNSLKISSVSQKVPGGLQHPTGDAENVMGQLENCDYVVVYLQDAFDTWYYCHDEIMEMRRQGTYDWKSFLNERYLPIVEEKVRYIESQPYKDKIVYCIYNECDNAVWFGNCIDGVCHYDEVGRANFYEAWNITYSLVKSIAPEAKIGGPGFCDYETTKIEGFMDYCSANDCLPQIMIWHELAYWSVPDWHMHYEDYRRIEKENGIDELDIIVTEYGEMEECGNPADMLHYIIAMEETGIWGNMAYWRLSNNLNDTCADDNSPNSNWWLYRRYAEMKGQQRLFTSSKTENKYNPKERLDGLATLSDDGKTVNMIVTGSDKRAFIKLESLHKTNLGDKVAVKVESVYYEGLSGIVSAPVLLRHYSKKITSDKININLPATDKDAVYFVTVTQAQEDIEAVRNTAIPKRYEFEKGKLQGDAYTYDSAYATTGEIKGMVGGMEKEGDGVRLNFTVSKKGEYDLDIIFGKHNDAWGNPQGRDYATVRMILDGKETLLKFENTIKSEYTARKTVTAKLSAGIHTIEFYNAEGTYVLDSMLVSPHEEIQEIYVLSDSEDGSAFLAVAPYDGYYRLDTKGVIAKISVDGASGEIESGDILYLRRGLNEISFNKEDMTCILTKTEESAFTATIKAQDIALSGKAELLTDKYGMTYIDNISNLGGEGSFTVSVPQDGDYRVTLLYANNSEGGVHSYNVDLIERYVTVTANSKSQDIFCRNTNSKYTYKTVTFNLQLNKGENLVTLTNSGNTVFHNMEAFAPQIGEISINALSD